MSENKKQELLKDFEEFKKSLAKPEQKGLNLKNLQNLNSIALNLKLKFFLEKFKSESQLIKKSTSGLVKDLLIPQSPDCLYYWSIFPKYIDILIQASYNADIELQYAQLDQFRLILNEEFMMEAIELTLPADSAAKRELKGCQNKLAYLLLTIWLKKDFMYLPRIPSAAIIRMKPRMKCRIRNFNRKSEIFKKWKELDINEFIYTNLQKLIIDHKSVWLEYPKTPVFVYLLKMIVELLSVGFYKADDIEELLSLLLKISKNFASFIKILRTSEVLKKNSSEYDSEIERAYGKTISATKRVMQKLTIQLIHLLTDEIFYLSNKHEHQDASIFVTDIVTNHDKRVRKKIELIPKAKLLVSEILFEILLTKAFKGETFLDDHKDTTDKLLMFVLDFKHQKIYPSNKFDYNNSEIQSRREIGNDNLIKMGHKV